MHFFLSFQTIVRLYYYVYILLNLISGDVLVLVNYGVLCNFRHYILAVGFENGEIEIEKWNFDQDDINDGDNCMRRWLAHSETINRLKYFIIIINEKESSL